ncbi:MAG: hypothetical protein ABI832_16285 [bacterium]
MPDFDLRPDCTHCDALCCVLLAFDLSTAFALAKPACTACPNLAGDNACTIHASLNDRGFPGCVAFDCHGAGQRLTSQLFKDRSWRDDPGLMPAMDNAFRILRRLHEAMALLQHAATLPLDATQQVTRQTLLTNLATDWTEADLQGPSPTAALRDADRFIASLRAAVTPPRP